MASPLESEADTSSAPRVWISSYLPQSRGAGVERFARSLADAVREAGFSPVIVDLASVCSDHSPIRRFRYPVAWKIGRFVNRRATPDDVIVCNNFFSWNARRMRSIVVFHGTDKGRAIKNRENMSFGRSLAVRTIGAFLEKHTAKGRIIVAVSEAVREEVERHYGFDVAQVIPNAVDLNLFVPRKNREGLRMKFGLPLDKFLLLYVGTPERRKGLGWLLESLLPKLGEDKRLVLRTNVRTNVSNPPRNALVIRRLPLEQLAELYASCDAFVFPTSYEGCSYSLVEALASGLPAITSPTGGGRDLLSDPRLRDYLIEGLDLCRYLECIDRLAESPDERAAVSAAARAFAEKNHDIRKFNQSYVSLIRRLSSSDDVH